MTTKGLTPSTAAVLLAGQILLYERGRCQGLDEGNQALIADMESEQQHCISELKPWLENTASEATYKSSRCLKVPKSYEPALFGLD